MALWTHCVETLLGHTQNISGRSDPEGQPCIATGYITKFPSLPNEDFLLNHPGQDPANHLPIQQELLAAQRHDDSFWVYSNNKEYNEKNSHVPFPFIATCLVVGASYDPSGYFHSTSIEPFYMPYCGGDNNNGEYYFCQSSHISDGGQVIPVNVVTFL